MLDDVAPEAWSGVHRGPLKAGEWIRLTDSKGRRHNICLEPGKTFHTNRGGMSHDDLIGREEGFTITSTNYFDYAISNQLATPNGNVPVSATLVPRPASAQITVNGAGPIGSLAVAALKHAGAARVTVADVDAASLAVARAMGADDLRDVSQGEPLPEDAEIVIEASGAAAALGAVLRSTARGGTLVQVGNLPGGEAAASPPRCSSAAPPWSTPPPAPPPSARSRPPATPVAS